MNVEVKLVEAETSPEFSLDKSAGHLLHRAVQFAADRFVAAIGDSNVTLRQFTVLCALEAQAGLTQTALVGVTGIDRSTLAELVTRMAAKSLVVRQRAEQDGRANIVRLTEQGRAELEALRPRVARADEAILKALSKGQRQSFLNALIKIDEAMRADREGGAEAKTVTKGGDKKGKKSDAEKSAKSAKSNSKKASKKAGATSKQGKKKKSKPKVAP